LISQRAGQCGSGRNRSHHPRPAPKRQPPGEATLLESTRDDAHAISIGIAIIGRGKRLLKIADQMRPELERDHPVARIVTLVGKLDIEASGF
jgi:hypothetical protein